MGVSLAYLRNRMESSRGSFWDICRMECHTPLPHWGWSRRSSHCCLTIPRPPPQIANGTPKCLLDKSKWLTLIWQPNLDNGAPHTWLPENIRLEWGQTSYASLGELLKSDGTPSRSQLWARERGLEWGCLEAAWGHKMLEWETCGGPWAKGWITVKAGFCKSFPIKGLHFVPFASPGSPQYLSWWARDSPTSQYYLAELAR